MLEPSAVSLQQPHVMANLPLECCPLNARGLVRPAREPSARLPLRLLRPLPAACYPSPCPQHTPSA